MTWVCGQLIQFTLPNEIQIDILEKLISVQGLLDPLRVCWAAWLYRAVATTNGEGLAAGLSSYQRFSSQSIANSKSSTSARDIMRRLQVVIKKMGDLKELGVPCAFCSGCVWWPQNNQRACKHNAGKAWLEESQDIGPAVHLPQLSGPLQQLNCRTLQSILTAILKDLQVDFREDAPSLVA